VPETHEVDVLLRRLNGDVSDLVMKHEKCLSAARRMVTRGRAAGLSDGQIARRANFVAATNEAERLVEQIKWEKAQFDHGNLSISSGWAELERLASIPTRRYQGGDSASVLTGQSDE
jgi:hypothetical protein